MDFFDVIRKIAGCITAADYTIKFVKWFWKWLQPEIKKVSRQKPKHKPKK